MLEKLTGTDIYSRISKTIYMRAKDAEEKMAIYVQPHQRYRTSAGRNRKTIFNRAKLDHRISFSFAKTAKSIEEKLNWIKNRETLFFEKEKAQKRSDKNTTRTS